MKLINKKLLTVNYSIWGRFISSLPYFPVAIRPSSCQYRYVKAVPFKGHFKLRPVDFTGASWDFRQQSRRKDNGKNLTAKVQGKSEVFRPSHGTLRRDYQRSAWVRGSSVEVTRNKTKHFTKILWNK